MTEFSYADELSSEYGLYLCNFGTDSNAIGGSQLEASQTKIVGTNEFLIINNDYSSPEAYTFQVGKMVNCDFVPITVEEYSKINRWLNRKQSHKFKKYSYDNIYWLGRFNISPITIGDDIYGLELTFIYDYPYGFLDDVSKTFSGNEMTILSQSDEVGFERPYASIRLLSDGDLIIRNSMDTEIFELKNCSKGEIITLDCKHSIIESSDKNHHIYDDFNWNFLKVVNTYDCIENVYTSSLDIELTITYAPVRKSALY